MITQSTNDVLRSLRNIERLLACLLGSQRQQRAGEDSLRSTFSSQLVRASNFSVPGTHTVAVSEDPTRVALIFSCAAILAGEFIFLSVAPYRTLRGGLILRLENTSECLDIHRHGKIVQSEWSAQDPSLNNRVLHIIEVFQSDSIRSAPPPHIT